MLADRTTEDYSPLQGPIINPHTGKDIRPRWMRQKYEAAVNARHEIIHDLFFEISLYESYDNRPSEGSEVNDWNVVTSLGYSF